MDALRFTNSRQVRRMTGEQVGAYILLLCEEWESGPLPDDQAFLANIGKCTVELLESVLAMCFKNRRGKWVNKYLEEVRNTQETSYNKRVRAGKAGAKVRHSKGESSNAQQPHSNAQQPHANRIEKKENRKEKK